MTPHKFLPSCLVLAVLALPVRAASPRDELLRLVPDDVAFCLVVQDLRSHLAALTDSPLAAQLVASPIGKALGGAPELVQLAEAEKFLTATLGIDWKTLRDEILGDAIVFAYRPGPSDKPEQEQGLILVRARSAPALAGLVERINKAQLASGELTKLEEREHKGVKYQCRIERDHPASYYVLNGPVLALSPQEDMLRRAIDQHKQARPATDETPPLAQKLRQLGADKALVTVWLNPRAFDADLDRKAGSATKPAEAVFLKTFGSYWKAIEGIAFSVVQHQDLELNLAVRVKPENLTLAARQFFSEAAQQSELWKAFPQGAILTAVGRFDVGSFLEMGGAFLDENTRKNLNQALDQSAGPVVGKVWRDLLPSIGPDFGVCIAPPSGRDSGPLPEVIGALRVRPHPAGKPSEQIILDSLNFFAGLAVLDYNTKHDDRLSLKTVQQDQVEVKYFVNAKLLPPGFQPAYALKDRYLLLASSPEMIRRFLLNPTVEREPAAEVPLVRLSCAALRSYLKDQREPLAAMLAEKDPLARAETGRRLDRLLTGLQFIDTIELTQRPAPGQVILTLRIKPSLPLRK